MYFKSEQIVKFCSSSTLKNFNWIDQEFSHNSSSIGNVVNSLGNSKYSKQLKWKKVNEIFGNTFNLYNEIYSGYALQGNLGNCYLVATLNSLAHSKTNIKHITDTIKQYKYGCFEVDLFLPLYFKKQSFTYGLFKYVKYTLLSKFTFQNKKIYVDDYFPVNNNNTVTNKNDNNYFDLEFCNPKGYSVWPIVIEKAFAKHFGSYWNSSGNNAYYALIALTSNLDMKIYKTRNFDNDDLFNIIKYYSDHNDIVLTSTNEIKNDFQLGLLSSHLYSVEGTIKIKYEDYQEYKEFKDYTNKVKEVSEDYNENNDNDHNENYIQLIKLRNNNNKNLIWNGKYYDCLKRNFNKELNVFCISVEDYKKYFYSIIINTDNTNI